MLMYDTQSHLKHINKLRVMNQSWSEHHLPKSMLQSKGVYKIFPESSTEVKKTLLLANSSWHYKN